MELDPQVPPYKTSDKLSFAYTSAKDRWPVILTGAIDDVHRTTGTLQNETRIAEGKAIVENLAKLKYELQHNRALTPIPNDGRSDVEGYNKELDQRGPPIWFDVSWLFAECYLYRRVSTLFSLSKSWRDYDVFARQKLATFKSSRPAVLELAALYLDLVKQLAVNNESVKSEEDTAKAEELRFSEMCQICLWGNATDLSLLTNLSYEDIQNLQGSSARKSNEEKILVNDLPAAFANLKLAQRQRPKEDRRVDIVLDNAGFELYGDLILAGYLIEAGLATTVVFHPKSIPWFVSDVIPKDFAALMNVLAAPQDFYSSESPDEGHSKDHAEQSKPLKAEEADNLMALFKDWATKHEEGQFVIRPNLFWTQAGSYWRMPTVAKDLYEDLQKSELVIFKGDLNYRKLTGDVEWPASTPFAESLGPLAHKGQGLKTLALRTCKADVVTGLPEGLDEKIKGTEGGGGDSGARKWAWLGKWAVVQYHDGKTATE